jgi:hypothetical protein
MQPKAKDTREIEAILQDAMAQAVDFVESEITDQRIKAQRYFDGQVDIGYEDGRSKVVATKVRDTVRSVKPSIMRVFMSTAKPVEFMPKGPEDVAAAEQATQYIHYVFTKNNGYRVLNDAIHDALIKKNGIVKAYWESWYDAEIYTYDNLTDQEYMLLVSEDDVEVLEHGVEMTMSVDEFGTEVGLLIVNGPYSRSSPFG